MKIITFNICEIHKYCNIFLLFSYIPISYIPFIIEVKKVKWGIKGKYCDYIVMVVHIFIHALCTLLRVVIIIFFRYQSLVVDLYSEILEFI